MPKVLVITALHERAMTMLQGRSDIEITLLNDVAEAAIIDHIADADAVTVRTARITPAIIEAGRKLRVIARHGVGYDNVDIPAATARGIPVTITQNANSASVAEQTLHFMLSQAKQGQQYDAATKAGNWLEARATFKTRDLGGATLLIMGVGRIGRRVAPLANAFGMRVLGYDPALSDAELKSRGVEPVSDWRSVLGDIDWLTLHCPRQADTIGMIGASELGAMRSDAWVINCARGGLIDEDALYTALQAGTIRGAALDVFDTEPAGADHPLLQCDNLLVSPHSAASSEQGMIKMGEATVQSVFDSIDGKLDPESIVNVEVIQ